MDCGWPFLVEAHRGHISAEWFFFCYGSLGLYINQSIIEMAMYYTIAVWGPRNLNDF